MPFDVAPETVIAWSLHGNTDTLTVGEFAAQPLIQLPALSWIRMGADLATAGRFEAPEFGVIEITNRIAEAA
ncbi:hypothetical protein [Inquilinus sp. OTU3971]|uniref:hypothetical protein n=1 Tax=Inquilinus sp. OTU3971 TaxID=3043855 RepID=UPI00313E9803